MKTIVEINNNNYGSTGNIMMNVAKKARENGYDAYTACKFSKEGKKFIYDNQVFVGYWLERVISEKLAYITSNKDCFNYFGTKKFIKKLESIKPDIIHLHNIHGSFINIDLLFKYIKKNNIPVIWTLHDNWVMTGQCATYGCDKWKEGCGNCPKLKDYPSVLFFDNTKRMLRRKEKLFNYSNMILVTPSEWLKSMLNESYLKNINSMVINNGIDLNVFKPTESDINKKYNIDDNKHIIIGVANYWNNNKGLDVFIKLANTLPDNYQIVLIGTNDEVDKDLPDKIISIHHTYNQEELVKVYSVSDVFVNPTRADNFPTVNIEALACGIPVITFNTDGSPEIIDETCGCVVEKGNIDALEKEIIRICETKPYKKEDCLKRASRYNADDKFLEYISLYEDIIK